MNIYILTTLGTLYSRSLLEATIHNDGTQHRAFYKGKKVLDARADIEEDFGEDDEASSDTEDAGDAGDTGGMGAIKRARDHKECFYADQFGMCIINEGHKVKISSPSQP
ncbi:MAG: hypothetical protein M1822_006476 [Bathelium mastoideum]|nr:MAG: hypothetical protein M1822_006476 [Bathelium mastoideum]